MRKNVAGQKIGAQITEKATGNEFSGAVVVYVKVDDDPQAVGTVGSGAALPAGNGYYEYFPSQAETNGDFLAFTFVGAGAITTTIQVPTIDAITSQVERVDGMLAAVKAKTDLITAAGVSIVSPVRQDGTLQDLVVGDAYQQAAGRAIEITVEDVSAGLQTILADPGATVHLGFLRYGKSRQNPDFRRYEFPGTIVSVAANTVVRFELTTDDTRDIVPSKYDYDVEFRSNANFVTAVSNAKGRPMEWTESATALS